MKSSEKSVSLDNLFGDVLGGTASMLVAIPSAIAFGLIIFAPLGAEFSGRAAIGGIIGTITMGLFAALFGGTKRLISAPCAPAAAVLSVFVSEMTMKGTIPPASIPIYVTLVSLFSGIVQVLIGKSGGGRFIKYIPYPVVAGYLSGVGVLIFFGQLPKFLGIPIKVSLHTFFSSLNLFRWESIVVGAVTILVMVNIPKLTTKVPAAILALVGGILTYLGLSLINPALGVVENNPFVIGPISASFSEIVNTLVNNGKLIPAIDFSALGFIVVPTLTLAVLLSIDTLKTCVVLDALTYSRHNSNKELLGQGIGNIVTAVAGGIPGAGQMGATLVNLNSGGKTQMSGVVVGVSSFLVLLLFAKLVAWIPYAALAGILMVVAVRMVDKKSFTLLKHKSTRFDFFCIVAVVISAVSMSLIAASGVGIAFAILLFLREQIRSSVIRRKILGNQIFSKKIRLKNELEILQEKGSETIVVELQGQLFFGTTDQLFTELEPFLKKCKYILLDMKRVQSIDYTAVNMLKQIQARVKAQKGFLVFASVPLSLPTGQNVKSYLEDLGLTETEILKFFNDLDSALEWIEDEILKGELVTKLDTSKALLVKQFDFFEDLSVEALQKLLECMEEKTYKPGELIFELGEESDEIYFIRRGMVKIVLPLSQGMSHHLITFPTGGFFGDMSFLDKGTRSANAVAVDDVELYVLSREKFSEVAEQYPELGGLFFERLARTIAYRLRQSNIEVKALQEN
ncbi:MAG: SLC26A/SulP transporter family protein [Ignavibacteria bacterium]|nr:SLC26A/SulP transporter family protein [Ignavibacteria bacterium]